MAEYTLAGGSRDMSREEERIDQLEVQLAGCMVAAAGWAKDPPKAGDYGWSKAFQDVLDLRAKYEEAVKRILPARAYIFNKKALATLFSRIFEVQACPKHGPENMKVCGACERVACGSCDPTFCTCQMEKINDQK